MAATEWRRIPFPAMCFRSISHISDCAGCIARSGKFMNFSPDFRENSQLLNIVYWRDGELFHLYDVIGFNKMLEGANVRLYRREIAKWCRMKKAAGQLHYCALCKLNSGNC
ncbi:hypothetical protein NX868_24675 [Burkholderia thailandensis]|uniref:Uncharacterized protein n=1 Tax=Burkholderia thailandensis TaxID=57975 RepID=A0AAW9CP87_BURTH|nr:hypothetical protein [Burkholderia thailandensis]MCS3394411.1 hypothetical protein [Burkholderia thailandensis]MCS6427556.1 hypothetical protein [Burkholderia thailandensis]MCS6455825.1 hypothetical protein [Burkholderia thailandensis]MCS6466721.1 hypothetical protein [Burkholderia thailandensis]MCS6485456.1 hypothetical protein [Burkholderia thailandensis]